MKKTFTLVICIATCINCFAQNYFTGKKVQTFTDASRNNRQVNTLLYYPADIAGDDVPLLSSSTKFPVVVFSHGFVIDRSSYDWLGDSLASHGYIAAFPSTEGSLSPSHTNFGNDLSFLCNYIPSLNDLPSSFLYGSRLKKLP